MGHTVKVLEMFLFSCARLSFDRDTDTFRQAVDLGVTTSSIFYLFFHRSHFWHWPVGKSHSWALWQWLYMLNCWWITLWSQSCALWMERGFATGCWGLEPLGEIEWGLPCHSFGSLDLAVMQKREDTCAAHTEGVLGIWDLMRKTWFAVCSFPMAPNMKGQELRIPIDT